MANTFFNIEQQLQLHTSAIPGSHVYKPTDLNFDMDAETVYLRSTNIPIPMRDLGLENSSSQLREGIFQIDIFTPRDNGIGEAVNLADDIKDNFPKGLISGTAIKIKRVDVEVAEPVGSHLQLPVLVYYSTITQ